MSPSLFGIAYWRRIFLGFAVVGALLAAACGGAGETPTPTKAAPTATSPAPTATASAAPTTPTATAPSAPIVTPTPTPTPIPAWILDWEKTLEAAKEEGTVLITVNRAAYRTGAEGLSEAFPDIVVEAFIASTPQERWVREYQAGVYSVDVDLQSARSSIAVQKPAGILGDTRAQIIRPDVLEDENWIGVFDDWWCDNDTKKHILCFWGSLGGSGVFVNTNLVSAEEFVTEDLLKPEFNGKWALVGPTGRGTARSWLTDNMATHGTDFIRQLLETTEPVLSEDSREMAAAIARGEFLACVGCSPIDTFHAQGIALYVVQVQPKAESIAPEFAGTMHSTCCGAGTGLGTMEGVYNSGIGGVALFRETPNPNAAKIFLNWLLTHDGQTSYSEPHGLALQCSGRVDMQDVCELQEMLDGHSYVNFTRTSTIFVREIAEEVIDEILGGR